MLASETDWAGYITKFTHDQFGRLIQVVLPDGATYQLECDAAGRMITMHRPDGSVRSYAGCNERFGRLPRCRRRRLAVVLQ